MDRLFPINNQPLDESEKALNLISAETVAEKLAEAQSQDNRLSAEVLEMIRTAKKKEKEEGEEKKDKKPQKGKIPEQLKPFIKKKKGDDEDSKDEDTEDDEKDEKAGPRVVRSKEPTKKANARIRKIYFASADQINAEAAKSAQESGDDALYQAILSARHDRRVAVASQILEIQKTKADVQEKLAKRNQYRMNLVAEAEKAEKEVKEVKANKSVDRGFKNPLEFTASERSEFTKIANTYNFPKEYIESQFVALIEPEAVTHIKTVMSSKLDDTTKRATVTAMVKTADLDDANVNRLLRYWKDELGYQDDQWIDHLFKTKYDTQKSAEASTKKK